MDSHPKDPIPEVPVDEAPPAEAPAPGQDGVLGRRKLPFWKRIGGDGLVASLVFHGALLLLFAAWVIVTITDEAKVDPETFATGSGGGAKGERAKVYEHKMTPRNAQNLAKTSARITSKSATASVALPDLPTTSAPSLLDGLSGGGSSKGFGGGTGGGGGTGVGPGRGGSNYLGVFGASFQRPNTLEGTLYDLKFDPQGGALGSDSGQRINQLQRAFETMDGDWSRARGMLAQRYRKAPNSLYATNLFIPPRNAGEATRAFECEKEIQAPGWLAYYEGWFAVPESGEYRFQGFADDMMAVAVDGTTVLSAFWPGQTDGSAIPFRPGWYPKDAHKTDGMQFREPRMIGHLGSRYKGGWLTLRKGQAYFIQVAISESHGGIFSSELLIEKKGATYAKGRIEDVIPYFMLEPMSPEEIKLKLGWKMPPRWGYGPSRPWHMDGETEGPSFGAEINNVTPRRGAR